MSDDCTRHEREIAAAAGADLPDDVQAHVDGCPGCARLRGAALALSRDMVPDPVDASTVLTLANRALAEARAPSPAYWIAPLISASATAAALILYFGFGDATHREEEGFSMTHRSMEVADDTDDLLSEELRAVSDLLLLQQHGEVTR